MAGNWPDIPSRKIAYDADGTVVMGRYPQDGAPYEYNYEWAAAAVTELNDLDFQKISGTWANGYFDAVHGSGLSTVNTWVFPEHRDIYGTIGEFGVDFSSVYYPRVKVYSSPDTTNGVDGTWTEIANWYLSSNMLADIAYPELWRTNVVLCSQSGVRGIRVEGNGSYTGYPLRWRSMFIFGAISAGETPDRILFIDNNTGLEFTTPMDWGDVPRGTTLDWDIYLKNNSSTLTANTMTLDFVTRYNHSDTWYTIKKTGGSFATTHSISSIANGARYPTGTNVLTVRMAVPGTEPPGVYEAILELSKAASWT